MSPHNEVEGAGMVPLFLVSVLPEQLSWQTSHRGASLYIDLDSRPCRLLPDGANSSKIAGITAAAEYREEDWIMFWTLHKWNSFGSALPWKLGDTSIYL